MAKSKPVVRMGKSKPKKMRRALVAPTKLILRPPIPEPEPEPEPEAPAPAPPLDEFPPRPDPHPVLALVLSASRKFQSWRTTFRQATYESTVKKFYRTLVPKLQPPSRQYVCVLASLLIALTLALFVIIIFSVITFFVKVQSPAKPQRNASIIPRKRVDDSLSQRSSDPNSSIVSVRQAPKKKRPNGPGWLYFNRPRSMLEEPRPGRYRAGQMDRTKTKKKKRKSHVRPPEFGFYGREGMRSRFYPIPVKRYRNVSLYERGRRCPDGAAPNYNIEAGLALPPVIVKKLRMERFLQKEVNRKWRNRCKHRRCFIDWERHDIICKGHNHLPHQPLIIVFIGIALYESQWERT